MYILKNKIKKMFPYVLSFPLVKEQASSREIAVTKGKKGGREENREGGKKIWIQRLSVKSLLFSSFLSILLTISSRNSLNTLIYDGTGEIR